MPFLEASKVEGMKIIGPYFLGKSFSSVCNNTVNKKGREGEQRGERRGGEVYLTIRTQKRREAQWAQRMGHVVKVKMAKKKKRK